MKLNEIILELEQLFTFRDKINLTISSKSVGWQINHILLVVNGVCKSLIKSDPATYQWKFNVNRFFVLTSSYIPRGSARAPKAVSPESYRLEELEDQMKNTISLLKRIKTLDINAHFIHPYFGDINLKTSEKFLSVHSYHHLKIIRDILR